MCRTQAWEGLKVILDTVILCRDGDCSKHALARFLYAHGSTEYDKTLIKDVVYVH